jgi:hypothetical protein
MLLLHPTYLYQTSAAPAASQITNREEAREEARNAKPSRQLLYGVTQERM